MALDRQSIEKHDFPVGSHGYDPQAVDAHLSALADEFSEYKSEARRRTETLASSASAQVRAIITAAETSAAEMQRTAEAEARDIREEAHQEARATRERASEDVREHVGRVSEATSAMLSRLDGMESELSGLIESLRNGASRLDSDLRELEAELGQVGEQVKPPARVEFQPDPEPAGAGAGTRAGARARRPECVRDPLGSGPGERKLGIQLRAERARAGHGGRELGCRSELGGLGRPGKPRARRVTRTGGRLGVGPGTGRARDRARGAGRAGIGVFSRFRLGAAGRAPRALWRAILRLLHGATRGRRRPA